MTQLQIWIAERSPVQYALIFIALVIVGVFALSTAYGSDSLRQLFSFDDDTDDDDGDMPPAATRRERPPLAAVPATGDDDAGDDEPIDGEAD